MWVNSLKPGFTSEKTSGSMEVIVEKQTPEGTTIPLKYTLKDNNGNTWEIADTLVIAPINNSFELAEKNIIERYGNGDNTPNRGETIYLNPIFKNTGSSDTNSLRISVSSNNSLVNIKDKNSSLSQIKPNLKSEKTNYSLEIQIDKRTPENTVLDLNYKIEDSFGNSWEVTDSLTVLPISNSFSLKNNNYVERYGNGDNVPNRGETIYLNPTFTNTGSSESNQLTLSVSSSSSYLEVEDNSSYLSSIKPGLASDSLKTALRVKISKEAAPGTNIPITYTLSDNNGNKWEISGIIPVM